MMLSEADRERLSEPRRPLECECPVCARVKRMIEDVGPLEDVGYRVGIGVSADELRGPEDRSGARGP